MRLVKNNNFCDILFVSEQTSKICIDENAASKEVLLRGYLDTTGVRMVVIKHLSNGPWLGLAFTQASQEECRQTHHHHTAFQRCLCNLIWKGISKQDKMLHHFNALPHLQVHFYGGCSIHRGPAENYWGLKSKNSKPSIRSKCHPNQFWVKKNK